MPYRDPTPAELIAELTDLFNDLQMAAAPKSYSQALLHCIAAARAADAAAAEARPQRWPSAARVVPFNRPLTYGQALR
jgi:hypothetical protein